MQVPDRILISLISTLRTLKLLKCLTSLRQLCEVFTAIEHSQSIREVEVEDKNLVSVPVDLITPCCAKLKTISFNDCTDASSRAASQTSFLKTSLAEILSDGKSKF